MIFANKILLIELKCHCVDVIYLVDKMRNVLNIFQNKGIYLRGENTPYMYIYTHTFEISNWTLFCSISICCSDSYVQKAMK